MAISAPSRFSLVIVLGALTSLIALLVQAFSAIPETELLSTDTDFEGDHFGFSVAVDGNLALVGVPDDDANGNDAGAVFSFARDSSGGWLREEKLLASETLPQNDNFGFAVAVDSNTAGRQLAVIGAPNANGTAGRAYVFERFCDPHAVLCDWEQIATLKASDNAFGDQFGSAVAIDLEGDTIVVGSEDDTISLKEAAGSAFVYFPSSLSVSSTPQVEQAKLIAFDGGINDHLGYAVAVDGDSILVGAPFDNNGKGTNAGAVYVYSRAELASTVTEAYKLDGSLTNDNHHFGWAIAMSQGDALIGAPGSDVAPLGINAGRVYVFEDGAGGWGEEHVIENQSLITAGDHFGNAVAVEGGVAVVGAFRDSAFGGGETCAAGGRALLYVREGTGANEHWALHDVMADELDAACEDDEFGTSVGIRDGVILVGAPNDEEQDTQSGAAYVFHLEIVDDDGDGLENREDNCDHVPNGPVLGTCIPGPWGVWPASGSSCTADVQCPHTEYCTMDQENSDGVGRGDACDANVDGDIYGNEDDRCPYDPFDILNDDSDFDGHGDSCDACPEYLGGNSLNRNNWTPEGCVECNDLDGDGYFAACDSYETLPPEDCDDRDGYGEDVYPGAPEECNDRDDDCDGLIDDGAGDVYYRDQDADDYSSGQIANSCTGPPAGYRAEPELIATSGDCRDLDPSVHPGAAEVCNAVDDDCDGETDEGLGVTLYYDYDDDGYPSGVTTDVCESGEEWKWEFELVSLETDCDDYFPEINPAAVEICNEFDDDCDGQVDDGVRLPFYLDEDGDLHADASTLIEDCYPPFGTYVAGADLVSIAGDCDDLDPNVWISCATCQDGDLDGFHGACDAYVTLPPEDCDDGNDAIHPGAEESCNHEDDDCDGRFDEDLPNSRWVDHDSDGYGEPRAPGCDHPDPPPDIFVTNDLDCDDDNPEIRPFQPDVCFDGVDDNCDGFVDENCNEIPFARCQSTVVAASEPLGCRAEASIDDGSYDIDGDPISFGFDPPGPYPPGTTQVTLTVTDIHDTSSSCQAEVGVVSLGGECFPGDANRDGGVDGADYTIWADHYGMSTPSFWQGDFNTDGSVDGADYTIWADHYGEQADAGGAGSGGEAQAWPARASTSTSAAADKTTPSGSSACGLGFELIALAPLVLAARPRARSLDRCGAR